MSQQHIYPKNIIFIQSRAKTNYNLVDEYAEMMRAGVQFDAAQGVRDEGGQVYVWDGLHRGEAARQVDALLPVEVRPGTKQDAEWLALTANQKHGLRRSRADRQWIVRLALQHPNGANLSNSAIARHCGVSDKTVGKIRREFELSSEIPKIEKRIVSRNGATYEQNTHNIGSNELSEAEKVAAVDSGQPARTAPDEPGRAENCPICERGTAAACNNHFHSLARRRQEEADAVKYLNHDGLVVKVSGGIGQGPPYGAFIVKANGISHKRLVSPALPMVPDRAEAQRNLDNYAAKKGWSEVTHHAKPASPAQPADARLINGKLTMALPGKDDPEFITLSLSTSGENGYKLERQPHPCPRCGQDRIVGVNGSQRWCLHCEAQWTTQEEFLEEFGPPQEEEPVGENPEEKLLSRFAGILAHLAGSDERLGVVAGYLAEMERELGLIEV